jgi:hypothetical protein
MYTVLIGSRALNFWYPERKIKETTDWDVISSGSHEGCEVHNPEHLNNKDMTGYRSSNTVALPDGSIAYVMSPLGLAIIKRSHLWRDLSFQKHITDYHKSDLASILQENLRFDIVQNDLKNRTELTKKEYPQGHPSLMKSVDAFFDDAVTKKYDHDFLHELFAYYDKPLYTRLQDNPELAYCKENLWYTLSYEDKLKCVAEETYVIAFERFIEKSPRWSFPKKLAYLKSLDKVCTTLTSGWFRDFAIDNYPQIVGLFDEEKIRLVEFKILSIHPTERKYHAKS